MFTFLCKCKHAMYIFVCMYTKWLHVCRRSLRVGDMGKEEKDYVLCRDGFYRKWIEDKLLEPWKTWGKHSNDQKIAMVSSFLSTFAC